MYLKMLKSKLHRARVTSAKIDYPGSVAIDSELMKAAGLRTYEAVLIADVDNGNRVDTYVVPAEAGSRDVIILGAAARLINPKDTVIIMSFGYYTAKEAGKVKPKVVALDKNNNIIGKVI